MKRRPEKVRYANWVHVTSTKYVLLMLALLPLKKFLAIVILTCLFGRVDRICLLEAELVVDHVFNGSNFLAVPNNSLLYNELYRLAYEDGCADRCTSCRQKASYVNRVQNASGRYTSIPVSIT